MRFLLTQSLVRFILRTPWSFGMALVGVTLGVTSIVSVHLISASVAQRLDGLVPNQLMSYSHFLHRENLQIDDYFGLRRGWRQGLYPEIVELAPLIDESVVLQGRSVRVVGIDLFGVGGRAQLEADLQTPDQQHHFSWQGVWVDESLADLANLEINGIVQAPSGTLVADIPTAQQMLGWSAQQISYVAVQQQPLPIQRDWAEALMPGFSAGWPAQESEISNLSGWQLTSVAQQNPANQFGKSVLFNISALGLLALLVAWFLIYQVAVTWLRRLWPVYQRLHVVGLDWGVLRRSFILGLTGVGLIAAVLGDFTGQALARFLYSVATGDAGTTLNLDGWVVFKAGGSALFVCVVGGWWAFRQTSSALEQVDKRTYWVVLVLLLVALVGVMDLPTGLFGGFISIAALSFVSAWLIAPLLGRLKQLSRWLPGPMLLRMSIREAIWYPRDVGVAMAGLILAMATAIGVGLMVDSFRVDFSKMLDQRLSYDLVVRGDARDMAAIEQAYKTHNELERLQSYRQYQRRIRGVPMEVVASRLDDFEAARYGHSGPVQPPAILISEQAAKTLDLSVGGELELDGGSYPVAGVFSSFGDLQPRLIVHNTHALAPKTSIIESLSLKASEPQSIKREIEAQYPELDLQLQSDIRRLALVTFDQTFTITNILILLAMLVASIGVYIAVTSLRLNKRGHSKLMQSMGINPLESVGMDLALGVGVGGVAILVAVPLGICFGWILCAVINPRAFGWTVTLQLNVGSLVTPVAWGLLAAMVASILRVGRAEGAVGQDGRS